MSGVESTAVKYLNQDFTSLKKQCICEKQYFSDPTFPAGPDSLGFKVFGPNSDKTKGVQWKRPGELSPKPQFIIDGAKKSDICQGALSDCWLMAAIASLTLNQDLLARVIHSEQNFTQDYAGIFHFQLWQYGQWVDVVIDDRLPTKDGKLLFVHSADSNEFWSALLEKAYAKVNGCYEALSGGSAAEAFEDLTGGIAERYELSSAPPNLFNIMRQALKHGSLLSTSISGTAKEKEAMTTEQLIKTHTYSITGAEEVHVDGRLVQLVCLRNPWGHKEWNGAWSDTSKEWNQVLPQEKAKFNHIADDGEFWMAYSDFMQRYSRVDICNLTPDEPSVDHLRQWNFHQFEGSWKAGATAGGSNKNKASFGSNPQFVIKLDSDGHSGTRSCSVLVGLMQKDVRKEKRLGHDFRRICFAIYPVPHKFKGPLSSKALSRVKPVIKPQICSRREMSQRFEVPPGQYVIIPSTEEPNQEGSFLLRVFFDVPSGQYITPSNEEPNQEENSLLRIFSNKGILALSLFS